MPQGSAGRANGRVEQDSPSGFMLTLSQIAVLWSVMAGLLLMSFLFGFYAGREQGLRVAFEQYSGQAARIPVAAPIASENSTSASLSAPNEPVAVVGSNASAGRNTAAELAAEDDAEFDFSPAGKLAAPVPVQPNKAGVAEKPTTAQGSKPARLGEVRSVSALPSGWYIQVAASKTREEADVVSSKMKAHDLSAAVEVAKVGEQEYYRVLIGGYESRTQAEAVRQQLAKKKLTVAVPFLKRIS